jgi:hypothetical protein
MDKWLCFPMLLAGYLFDLHIDPEDRDSAFFQNLCEPSPEYTALLQSQSYFMTGGLPPIDSSWRQAPWDSYLLTYLLNPFLLYPTVLRLFFFISIILQTVGLLGRVISSSQGLYLTTGQHKHRINTYTYQTSMPCVGFELTIPASEHARQYMP